MLHLFNAPPWVGEKSELSWANVLVLFDFSPHIKEKAPELNQQSDENPKQNFGGESDQPSKEGSSAEPRAGPSSEAKLGPTAEPSVGNKHLAWARAIRDKVPHAVVIGYAFDGNKYHQWVVKDDGSFTPSPVFTLPRAVDPRQPLEPFNPDEPRAWSRFLTELDSIISSDGVLGKRSKKKDL